jgi:5,10-methylene-tetrahydrofolate dehydrogenase/methenyl tetrahydrofolate cyclohydrolase
MATIIDGKAVADAILEDVRTEVENIAQNNPNNKVPGLAVILVGDRKDSATYVRMKKKACEKVGIQTFTVTVSADITLAELMTHVEILNADPAVHGILVQLPLPAHIDEEKVLNHIVPEKDVDGLHPMNVAALAIKSNQPHIVACTPAGCLELLDRHNIIIEGKQAVVLGRSRIVGIPVSLLLIRRNATVTICHSKSQNIEETVRQADIIVACCGQAEMVKASWLKPGVAVIDVGINAIDDATKRAGYRLVGDVDFNEAKNVAGAITPVPGGVGPMTIAMLLKNTLRCAQRAQEK